MLRLQCNQRQRKVYNIFRQLLTIQDDVKLAEYLTGDDSFDNSLRLCAFLELEVETNGPFAVIRTLDRLRLGKEQLGQSNVKMDYLSTVCPDAVDNLIATIVHGLGQHLASSGCTGKQMQAVVDALSHILTLSEEIDVGRVYCRVLPKLVSGEIALCYLLLLATDLAMDEASKEELWRWFVKKIEDSLDRNQRKRRDTMAISALVVVAYCAGGGIQVLFLYLYAQLYQRNYLSAARQAWVSLRGDASTWDRNILEAEKAFAQQAYLWSHQRTIIDDLVSAAELASRACDELPPT